MRLRGSGMSLSFIGERLNRSAEAVKRRLYWISLGSEKRSEVGRTRTRNRAEVSCSDRLVDIAGEKRGETEKAIRIYDGAKTEWMAKRFVEENNDLTFTMPEWLAKDKGFI